MSGFALGGHAARRGDVGRFAGKLTFRKGLINVVHGVSSNESYLNYSFKMRDSLRSIRHVNGVHLSS